MVRCIDHRIQPTILAKLLSAAGYPEGSYDIVSVAGAGQGLIYDNSSGKAIMENIHVAVQKHNIKKVVVIQHDDCAAYDIKDPRAEDDIQQREINAMEGKLYGLWPGLQFAGFILKGTATGNLLLQKIV